MHDQHACLECGESFEVSRKPENRAAFIRYCGRCKDGFEGVRQSQRPEMRTVTDRPGGRGRTSYLSVN